MKRFIVLASVLFACSSHPAQPIVQQTDEINACYNAPASVSNIVGLGFNAQPRLLGTTGAPVKSALDLLVNDLGASFVRVEANAGEGDWETVNDDADPNHFAWSYYDTVFSTPMMQKTWDYIRYLNQLGVEHVELAQHGGIPLWMGNNTPPTGSTQTSYPGPADGRAYVLPSATEDEFVETCVAMLVYARTRTATPHPQFDLFSPWNEPEFSGEGEGIDVATGTQRASILHKLVVRMNALPELNGIQLSVGEDGSEPGMIMTRQAIANDSLVMARTAATSFHRYGDESLPASYGDWRGSNPPVWMTESNSTWLSSCYDTTWTMGMQAAGNLLRALQNGVTAGLLWSDYDAPHRHQGDVMQTFGVLATTYQGKSGTQLCPDGLGDTQPSDAALDSMTYAPKPTYWALRPIIKWIRPNASPLAVTASGGVQTVAYLNADGTTVVAGRNGSGSLNSTVTLTMSNPPSYLTPRVSVSGSYDQIGSPVALSAGSGVFSLPGQSVFTLLSSPGDGSGGSGGQGGMSSGGQAGAAAGNGGAGGQAAGNGGAPSGGQSGSSGTDQGGMSGAGGASSGAGGQSGGGQGGASAGASGASGSSSGGAGAGSGGAGAGGQAGAAGSAGAAGAMVAAWSFNEGSGTTAADATGRGHTGTLVGSPTWTTGCKYGGCLTFSGTGKRVEVADADDLDLGSTFTVMAWVKPTSTAPWKPVLIKENGPDTESYLLYSNPSNQGAYYRDANNEYRVTGSGNVSTSQWTHIAIVRSGTTFTWFTAGMSVGSVTVPALPATTSSGILSIGGHTFWQGEWMAGGLDDIRIYNYALTQAQIATAVGSGL